jgi:CRP-like cAMP-binding protein
MYVGLDRRVYRCLLRLGQIYSEGAPPALIPMTQDQLSDLVGGTRPSVNQVLQRLQDQRIIELGRGRVVVLNPQALARKAGL